MGEPFFAMKILVKLEIKKNPKSLRSGLASNYSVNFKNEVERPTVMKSDRTLFMGGKLWTT